MRPFVLAPLGLVAALTLAACEQAAVPAQFPPGAGQFDPGRAGPGPAGPGPAGPAQGNPGQLNPGQFTPPGQVPAPPVIPPGPPVASDPINDLDMPWLRAAAAGVLSELTAALPQASQARVVGVPFITDPTVGEVNAYAACNEKHLPLMAITDGLLQIESYIAQLRATDEVFGTRKLDAYLRYMAQAQKPREPIVAPPPGFIDPVQHADYRKVVRQHHLLEEQMAFVLGHELAHHHLGHTGCANGQSGNRDVTMIDVFRKFSRIVPGINQPNELWADEAGVWNMLSAGARRPGYHWTEQGALLTLDFFARLDKLTLESIVFAFDSSHPNPALRVDPIKDAARRWRQSGGAGTWQAPMLP
jgi:hypothetical protein